MNSQETSGYQSGSCIRALDKGEYLIIGIILLILYKNICCDPSSEPSHRDGSDEGSQHMVSMRNKKNYPSVKIIYPLLSRALIYDG